ncbi:alpha/beta hydrolase [Tersicoccus phoenicis]|uniref:Alpha/beta hydrolase n=1 Tax=Tersicoccus phoenicis TaxID=554083 RepID=A0A1R1L9J8_9MICC|nr:alpha/beta hydrolase [Tersicoccus phoenicis]OMH24197.1 alpha/beta hydrolase [Tersicoccus phoenicis]
MDVLLIPGFWLDGASWAPVLGPLEAAGHRVHPLTLPGKDAVDADRSGIGLRDHVDAVVARIDALDGPVVLVGHSGGGAIIHAAADARPDRVARNVYVDSGPLGAGAVINDEIPTDGPDAPLPPWEFFEDADLTDLTDELRTQFRARAVPEPARVTSDPQRLHDERRFDVPVTVIACEFSGDQLREWVAAGNPFVAELGRVRDVDIVDLPTGHWPQFTRPGDLAEALVAAVGR